MRIVLGIRLQYMQNPAHFPHYSLYCNSPALYEHRTRGPLAVFANPSIFPTLFPITQQLYMRTVQGVHLQFLQIQAYFGPLISMQTCQGVHTPSPAINCHCYIIKLIYYTCITELCMNTTNNNLLLPLDNILHVCDV